MNILKSQRSDDLNTESSKKHFESIMNHVILLTTASCLFEIPHFLNLAHTILV